MGVNVPASSLRLRRRSTDCVQDTVIAEHQQVADTPPVLRRSYSTPADGPLSDSEEEVADHEEGSMHRVPSWVAAIQELREEQKRSGETSPVNPSKAEVVRVSRNLRLFEKHAEMLAKLEARTLSIEAGMTRAASSSVILEGHTLPVPKEVTGEPPRGRHRRSASSGDARSLAAAARREVSSLDK